MHQNQSWNIFGPSIYIRGIRQSQLIFLPMLLKNSTTICFCQKEKFIFFSRREFFRTLAKFMSRKSRYRHKILQELQLKRVFSKPSGKVNVGHIFFIDLETSNFGYLIIYYFGKLCKVCVRLSKLDIWNFTRVPHLAFGQICSIWFKLCTVHQTEKNKPVAKIWSL